MSKTYIAINVKNMDDFDADVMNLVKPEYKPNTEEIVEEIQAQMEESDADCTQIWDLHIDAEKAISNHDIIFKFNIIDGDFTLSIDY